MNKDPRGPRNYKKEKFYSKSQVNLYGRKHPKDEEIDDYAQKVH